MARPWKKTAVAPLPPRAGSTLPSTRSGSGGPSTMTRSGVGVKPI